MDTEIFLGTLGGFLGTLLASLGAFLVLLLRDARRTQALADKKVREIMTSLDLRATADRASHERTSMAFMEAFRAHTDSDERAFDGMRRRLSDVHDAIMGCPGRSNGAGSGHVRGDEG